MTLSRYLLLYCLSAGLSPGRVLASPASDIAKTQQEGEIKVPLDYHQTGGNSIKIHYKLLARSDAKREAIVFISGGPGISLSAYDKSVSRLKSIGSRDILLYDQRGVGLSDHIPEAMLTRGGLEHFLTDDSVMDIDQLRKQVIKKDRIILMGHSYGALLAFAYAARFPEHTSAVISLNGSLDSYPYVLQKYAHRFVVEEMYNEVPTAERKMIQDVLEQELPLHSLSHHLDGNFFTELLRRNFLTYREQVEYLGFLRRFVLSGRDGSHSLEFSMMAESLAQRQGQSALGELIMPYDELVMNSNIYCNELMPAPWLRQLNAASNREIQKIPDEEINRCNSWAYLGKQKAIDMKDKVAMIKTPTLIIGGKYDSIVPKEIQLRDYNIFRRTNSHVSLVIIDKSGHDPFSEGVSCLEEYLHNFLSGTLGSNEYTCAPPSSNDR